MTVRTIIGAGLIAAVAGRIAYALTAPVHALILRITDDSYYYFQVAWNVVCGRGLTFDGINETNGFHPLWMAVLLPVHLVADADPTARLRLIAVLITVLAGLSLWIAYRSLARLAGIAAGLVGVALMLTPPLLNPLLCGLEPILTIPLLFVLIGWWSTCDIVAPDAPASRQIKLGLLLGLIFLSRLDTAFIILAVLVAIFVAWVRQVAAQRSIVRLIGMYARIGLASAVLVAPYIIWNVHSFDAVVPISGKLKTTFPDVSFTGRQLASSHTLFGVGLLGVGALVWVILFAQVRAMGRRLDRGMQILLALWIGCALHFVNTLLFMNWAVHWWHYASYIPMALVGTALVVRLWVGAQARPMRVAAPLAAAIVVAAVVGYQLDERMRGKHHQPWLDAAQWTGANLPDGTVLGMTDCGMFGFFCRHATVNLDGVINGRRFQDALRDRRLHDYLRDCGITHMADYEVRYRDGMRVVRLPARLYQERGGALLATPLAEVYRSEPYRDAFHADEDIHFAIWTLDRLTVINDAAVLLTTDPRRLIADEAGPSSGREATH